MADKLRVAIIGCGRMGQYYAHVYSQLPNTEIVAIAEYNDDRRRAAGERFGVPALVAARVAGQGGSRLGDLGCGQIDRAWIVCR